MSSHFLAWKKRGTEMEAILKYDERAIFALRALYRQYGYTSFKMSKFEEYDLYVQNKDFLVSDRVIAFNDTDGRFLALKPDVTLSIIKNTVDEPGCVQKVCYNENVYRVSGSTHQFKEIMQTGLECIGEVDLCNLAEVLYLAGKSLATVSDEFTLNISSMGIITAILDQACKNELFKKEIIKLIAEKNSHEARSLCEKYSLDKDSTEKIVSLTRLYGGVDVLSKVKELCTDDSAIGAYSRLFELCSTLNETEIAYKIRIDFSVVNDMNYYNGIVFKGFVNGVPEDILSGGEYDTLMRRMGRASKAIGFALYLDLLEALDKTKSEYDVDVLLLYSASNSLKEVMAKKDEIVKSGRSVSAQMSVPSKLRCKEIIDIRGEAKQ